MRTILSLMLICLVFAGKAQQKLSEKDLVNLVAISELYSSNMNTQGEQLAKSVDSLRTPALSNFVNAFIATGRTDTAAINLRFQRRPDNNDLKIWYILRDIHYNNVSKTKTKRPALEVAKETFAKNIDERWLLINYYYRIHNGMAMLFNDADLSNYNFDLDQMGFKNDTEKAIFYFSITDRLLRGRYMVLKSMKNDIRISEVSKKMVKFNGKPYYHFMQFAFPDFEYWGFETPEQYRKQNLDYLMNTLMIQFIANMGTGDRKVAEELYYNSILSQPAYFEYGNAQESLKALYEKWKK